MTRDVIISDVINVVESADSTYLRVQTNRKAEFCTLQCESKSTPLKLFSDIFTPGEPV